MAEVVIYTRDWCSYCHRAKRLLELKGVAYREIDIEDDPAQADLMLERSGGRRLVPQIFIDEYHVGGSDDLAALEAAGRLDELLGLNIEKGG